MITSQERVNKFHKLLEKYHEQQIDTAADIYFSLYNDNMLDRDLDWLDDFIKRNGQFRAKALTHYLNGEQVRDGEWVKI